MLEIQLPTLLQITIKWKIACPLRLRYGMLREGETRYSSGTEQTKYTYTGQYSYTSDFGLHFYNARWYDSSLGRFAQADTIVPSGSQGLDRYAYVNNSPVMYIDPTGHYSEDQIKDYLKNMYGDKWHAYLKAWRSDDVFWEMLLAAQNGDVLQAPTTELGNGLFMDDTNGGFTFVGEHDLYEYQGYGPYNLLGDNGGSSTPESIILHPVCTDSNCGSTSKWEQPIYDYSSGIPKYTGYHRVVSYDINDVTFNPLAGDSIPWGVGALISWTTSKASKSTVKYFLGPVGVGITIISGATFINNSVEYHAVLSVDYVDKQTYIGPIGFTPPTRTQPNWIAQNDR